MSHDSHNSIHALMSSQLAYTQSLLNLSQDGLKACTRHVNITHPIDESKTPC